MLFAAQQFVFSSILAYFKCVHEQLQVIFVMGIITKVCISVQLPASLCEHMSTNMMFTSYFSKLTLPQEKDAKRGPSTVMLFQENSFYSSCKLQLFMRFKIMFSKILLAHPLMWLLNWLVLLMLSNGVDDHRFYRETLNHILRHTDKLIQLIHGKTDCVPYWIFFDFLFHLLTVVLFM